MRRGRQRRSPRDHTTFWRSRLYVEDKPWIRMKLRRDAVQRRSPDTLHMVSGFLRGAFTGGPAFHESAKARGDPKRTFESTPCTSMRLVLIALERERMRLCSKGIDAASNKTHLLCRPVSLEPATRPDRTECMVCRHKEGGSCEYDGGRWDQAWETF